MNNSCESPHAKHCEFADAAAERAVKRTFAILGVDVDQPASVEAFREDLRFGKRLRKFADYGALVFAGAVAVAMAGALWLGLTTKIKGG